MYLTFLKVFKFASFSTFECALPTLKGNLISLVLLPDLFHAFYPKCLHFCDTALFPTGQPMTLQNTYTRFVYTETHVFTQKHAYYISAVRSILPQIVCITSVPQQHRTLSSAGHRPTGRDADLLINSGWNRARRRGEERAKHDFTCSRLKRSQRRSGLGGELLHMCFKKNYWLTFCAVSSCKYAPVVTDMIDYEFASFCSLLLTLGKYDPSFYLSWADPRWGEEKGQTEILNLLMKCDVLKTKSLKTKMRNVWMQKGHSKLVTQAATQIYDRQTGQCAEGTK